MCAETNTLVHEKTSPAVTQIGEWNEFTVASLRQMWADGISTAEMGRRLGFSKSAICGKVDRLDLPNRPRICVGNAAVDPALAEQIKGMHNAGKTILQIYAVLGDRIGRHRIARVIGHQGKGWAATRPSARPVVASGHDRIVKTPTFRVVNLHTLDLLDDVSGAIRETQRYLTHKRKDVAPIPPRAQRQCEAVYGPRFHTVQCEGIRDDLRSPYCPDCRAKFTITRAA